MQVAEVPGPIGVFDSGLGGLSVLAHLERIVPNHPIVYLADQASAPYGDRPPTDIRRLTTAAVAHLSRSGSSTMVIACHTASDAALDELRAAHPELEFVGVEPAVKPAAAASSTGVIGVLATTRTVGGRRLAKVVAAHAAGVRVVSQACPGLVELVEDGLAASPHARELVARYVRPVIDEGADVLVLGCTHYTFLAEAISHVAGPGVEIVDPAEAVARRTASVVGGSTPRRAGARGVRYETTGDPVRFRRQIEEMTGRVAATYRARTPGPAAITGGTE